MSYLCPRVDYSLICTKFSVNIIAVGIACVVGIYAAYPVSGVKSSREGFPAKNRGTDSSRRRGCRAELDICIRNNIVMRSIRHIDQIRANITCCSIILKLNLIPIHIFTNNMNVRPTFSGTNDSAACRIRLPNVAILNNGSVPCTAKSIRYIMLPVLSNKVQPDLQSKPPSRFQIAVHQNRIRLHRR